MPKAVISKSEANNFLYAIKNTAIAEQIFSFLSIQDFCNLSAVSKHFKQLMDDDIFWKNFLRRDFTEEKDEYAELKSYKEIYLELWEKNNKYRESFYLNLLPLDLLSSIINILPLCKKLEAANSSMFNNSDRIWFTVFEDIIKFKEKKFNEENYKDACINFFKYRYLSKFSTDEENTPKKIIKNPSFFDGLIPFSMKSNNEQLAICCESGTKKELLDILSQLKNQDIFKRSSLKLADFEELLILALHNENNKDAFGDVVQFLYNDSNYSKWMDIIFNCIDYRWVLFKIIEQNIPLKINKNLIFKAIEHNNAVLVHFLIAVSPECLVFRNKNGYFPLVYAFIQNRSTCMAGGNYFNVARFLILPTYLINNKLLGEGINGGLSPLEYFLCDEVNEKAFEENINCFFPCISFYNENKFPFLSKMIERLTLEKSNNLLSITYLLNNFKSFLSVPYNGSYTLHLLAKEQHGLLTKRMIEMFYYHTDFKMIIEQKNKDGLMPVEVALQNRNTVFLNTLINLTGNRYVSKEQIKKSYESENEKDSKCDLNCDISHMLSLLSTYSSG